MPNKIAYFNVFRDIRGSFSPYLVIFEWYLQIKRNFSAYFIILGLHISSEHLFTS
jgi:hypothetical protein